MAKKEPQENAPQLRSLDPADRIFRIIVIILCICIVAIILYPIWFVVIASISNSDLVNQGKVVFWPKDIRFYGFQQVFSDSRIWIGYRNTIFYVVIGTLANLAVTLPSAYALSRKEFRPRNIIMFYFVFTMYFSGGLVPTYMQVNSMGLINSPWILVIMVLVNTYNLIIARTFIQNTIPAELYESATLDGASHFRIFASIVMPLSKAIIAVEMLYYAVFHWNDYFNALIYTSNTDIQPLQMVLRRILLLNEAFASGNGGVQGGYAQSSADQVKYAVIIVSTVPILMVYPFLQKYFEKGVMIGAVKG